MNYALPPSLHAASFTWFFYDYLLSFAEEVEFVWMQRKNWTTCAYIVTKFLTCTMVVTETVVLTRDDMSSEVSLHHEHPVFENTPESPKSCFAVATFMGAAGYFVTIYADLLLTFRIYYMYDCNKRLLIWSLILYACVLISSTVLICVSFPLPHKFFAVSFDRGRCFMESPKLDIMPAGWLVGLGYQIYLAAFALAKVRQAYIHRHLLGSRVSLLALIVAGNLQYYAVMVLVNTTTTALSFRTSGGEIGSYYPLTSVAMGIFGPKLLRDMRRMLTDSGGDPTFSTIQFSSQSRTIML